MGPQVIRAPAGRGSAAAARAEEIALALMGAGALAPEHLLEGAAWERGEGRALVGRAAILAALGTQPAPERIVVEQVVTHGKAGSVAGRLTRPGAPPRLFCHLIRFSSASAHEVAQLVSFEHPGGPHG